MTDFNELASSLIENIDAVEHADLLPSIYFVGKAGAGKSFAAKFMIEKYNYQVAKFAYPVYMIAEKYFNMQLKDRKLLQVIGTDVARDTIDQDIWVKRFKQDMIIVKDTAKQMGRREPRFVMDDCRFPNEYKVLCELGFVGIYLDVSDEIRRFRLVGRDGTAQENTLNHKSETLIDTFKDNLIQLDASGDLEETYYFLNETLKELARRYVC